jgi:hypothetical protein
LKKAIKLINKRRVEVDIRNNLGYTPLLLTIKNCRFDNAIILVEESNASLSIRDNEFHYNALEWLTFAVKNYKTKITTPESANVVKSNQFELFNFNTTVDSNNKSPRSVNYKSWYQKTSQYYNSDDWCDHDEMPNYSTEHHKSHFIPPILTPRVQQLQKKVLKEKELLLNRQRELGVKEAKEFNDKNKNRKVEDYKQVAQKLYEIIYTRMAQVAMKKVNLATLQEQEQQKKNINLIPTKSSSKITLKGSNNNNRKSSTSGRKSSMSNEQDNDNDSTSTSQNSRRLSKNQLSGGKSKGTSSNNNNTTTTTATNIPISSATTTTTDKNESPKMSSIDSLTNMNQRSRKTAKLRALQLDSQVTAKETVHSILNLYNMYDYPTVPLRRTSLATEMSLFQNDKKQEMNSKKNRRK